MKLILTYVGKVIALLGILAVLAAFGSLASELPAGSRWLRFLGMLFVGLGLLGAGGMLMKRMRA